MYRPHAIALMIRHRDPMAARRAALCAAECVSSRGSAPAGNERVGEMADFAWGFDCARGGLGLTLHAGELKGPEEIRKALSSARAGRSPSWRAGDRSRLGGPIAEEVVG